MAHNSITFFEVIKTASAALHEAHLDIQADSPSKFNTAFQEMLLNHINTGKAEALTKRRLNPDATMHIYHGRLSLDVYKQLSKDQLQQLKAEGIELYTKDNLDHAMVKIVYQF